MRKIYFVRHGESKHNATGIYAGTIDSPLTALGISQAKETGNLLKSKNIGNIITSNLTRAHDTATIISNIIAASNTFSLQTTPYLNEVNFGDIQNKEIQNIDGLIYGVESGTGESLESLYNRGYKVLELLQNTTGEEHILVVGHGAFTAVIFAIYQGIPIDKFIDYKRKWTFNNGEIKETFFKDLKATL